MDKLFDSMQTMRRYFHTMAEPGWLEFRTTIEIIKRLDELGYDLEYGKSIHSDRMGLPSEEELKNHAASIEEEDFDISEILQGYTGVVASLDTGRKGPTIAGRFDIDANDIVESEDENHRPVREGFASKNHGAMHACGHDGHITIGLHVAKWIADNKDRLKGKYILVFQPAEEGVRGAKSMVDAEVLKGVDYFIGGHLGLGVESGKIGLGTSGFLATTKLDIVFEGKASHAGLRPEEGKNALLGAASCSLGLHSLTQFSEGMSRVNVGRLEAGSGRNVVPAKAKMIIETRGESENINRLLGEKVKNVIKGSAQMYDLEYKVEQVGGAPAYLSEDTSFIEEFKENLDLESKDYDIFLNHNFGASEDVTYMMNYVEEAGGQPIHLMYGSDIAAGHHNELFDIDEKSLVNAFDVIRELIEYINSLD